MLRFFTTTRLHRLPIEFLNTRLQQEMTGSDGLWIEYVFINEMTYLWFLLGKYSIFSRFVKFTASILIFCLFKLNRFNQSTERKGIYSVLSMRYCGGIGKINLFNLQREQLLDWTVTARTLWRNWRIPLWNVCYSRHQFDVYPLSISDEKVK